MNKINKNKSVGDSIIDLFSKPQYRYKGVPVNFLGFPVFSELNKKQQFSKEIYRFKKKGIIIHEGDFLMLTPKGKEYIKKKQDSLQIFSNTFKKDSPKNLIVMFDIPEGKKAEREWFRFHLKRFNYVMVQRSVWVGPSPLPKDFMNYVEDIN
ncbi:MAG: hypothetical protein NTZ44_01450 [Candidatus Nomurabacteria bacterium]|nr:hypothetical protein [Candidatus Nomurabacteria bacterium]